MDWATIGTLFGFLAFYAVGKGIGRAQGRSLGRRDQMPPICLTLELEGEVIGGLHLSGIRVGPGWTPDDEPKLSGPPPGHPEA